jgi:hypothetical protein
MSPYEIVLATAIVCVLIASLVVIPLRNKADEPDEIHEADPKAIRELEIECQTGPGWDDFLAERERIIERSYGGGNGGGGVSPDGKRSKNVSYDRKLG